MTEKDRELSEAHSEIRALKLTERAKEKALAEVPSPPLFGSITVFFRVSSVFLHGVLPSYLHVLLYYQVTEELEKMMEKLQISEATIETKVPKSYTPLSISTRFPPGGRRFCRRPGMI